MILRYAILLLASVKQFYIFLLIFTPLTIYFSYFLLNIFYDVSILNNILLVNGVAFEFIEACIAPAAFFLLFALNLSIPKIKIKKRIRMIVFSLLVLLILNVLRILILVPMYFSGTDLFEATHRLFWYGLSTLFVVGIWLFEVKLYNLRNIPFYTDLKYLYKHSCFSKTKK